MKVYDEEDKEIQLILFPLKIIGRMYVTKKYDLELLRDAAIDLVESIRVVYNSMKLRELYDERKDELKE